MFVMRGFDLRGKDFKSSSPLSPPAQIVDNIGVQLADCLKGQPAQRYSNS